MRPGHLDFFFLTPQVIRRLKTTDINPSFLFRKNQILNPGLRSWVSILSLRNLPAPQGPGKSARATTLNTPPRRAVRGAEPRAATPPVRLSARGAGPDVTLVRAAARGRPDALSPALRGRGARGSSGRGLGEGGGVGPRAASGAGATGQRRRGVFRPSAAVCIFCLSFLQF